MWFDTSNMDIQGQVDDHHGCKISKNNCWCQKKCIFMKPNLLRSYQRTYQRRPCNWIRTYGLRNCILFWYYVCDFITISSDMSVAKVNNMLNHWLIKFEETFDKAWKGDAGKSITNVVEDQDDHVMRVAQFTINATLATKQTPMDVPVTKQREINHHRYILDYKMFYISIIIQFHDTKLHHNAPSNKENCALALIV